MMNLPTIPGIKISSSGEILNRYTKLAHLIWAPSGYGKTKLAGTLDNLTQKYEGKRILYIAVESSEGGGAATLRSTNVPVYVPKDFNELERTIGYLRNDKSIGGVVLDSATELFKQHIKPIVLKYPCKGGEDWAGTRKAGVLVRGDYQVSGELVSQFFRKLMALTTHENPEYRKHLVITATDQTKTDSDDNDKVVWQGPDLPGRMSREAVQLFQVVSTIEIGASVVGGKRVVQRNLVSTTTGIISVKDRFEVLPASIPIRKDPSCEGEDLETIWTKFWLPAIKKAENGNSSGNAPAAS